MSDKSINSLLGSLATKELPASGRSQTVNNSISTNHDEDSFHAKLLNSMENNQTSDRQTDTDIPSESNSMKNTQTTDKRTASNNSTNSNSVKITQTSDEQIINNIPTEPNLMKNTQPPDEQTATDIPSELANAKTADDINHIVKLLSIGLQTSQTTNTDGNQAQLSREVNQNVKANEFANVIINKKSNYKILTAQPKTNTLIEDPPLSNLELKSLSKPNSNIAQKQTGDPIPEPATYQSAKLNTTQVTTNITQQIPGEIEQGQQQTSLSDKFNTVQSNTKIGEHNILDIKDNPGLSGAAIESKGEESMPKLSKLPTQQAIEPSLNDLNKNQNKVSITGNQETAPTTKKAGLNPMPGAGKVSNSKIIDINTSSHTDEISNNKIGEMLKEHVQNKPLSPNTDKKPQAYQGLTQTQTESEETPKIFEASSNPENKAAKLFDNTTLTSSNDIKAVEATIQSNTSSDSSTFNNQGANTDFDFSSNMVNNSQKNRLETSFNNTLSQTNSTAKPLGTIGNDVADNIIQSAKLFTQGGKSEIKVQLSPPELGTIKLEFKVEDDVLETKITVERSSVKDVIEKDIPRLKELLSNADIDVGKLNVSLQDKENSKMDFLNKDFHSDSKSKSTQNSPQQESEYHDDNLEEEAMSNNTESTQINYLV